MIQTLIQTMNGTAWFESFFGDDYFEIYRDVFPVERTAAEVDGIVSLLRLQAGARVLDLACGHGRHAIPLAKRGFDVTGYDLSQMFLERAQVDAEAQGATVRWVHGDMRELPFDGEFDAVINIFTAFGYFEDPDDDLKVLHGIRRALKQGGRFLLETLHRDGLPARFRPRIADKTSNGTIVLHETVWDLARNVIDDHVTLIRPDGTRTQYTTAVRSRSLHEFLALMRRAGLEPTAWYGGLDSSTLRLDSQRLALLSTRL
ncbi:MAG: class I SAM-dependent methyltransferase [Candidatus Rokuibacteriota bacterium]